MPGHYGGVHSSSSNQDTGSNYGQFERAVQRSINNPVSTPEIDHGNPTNDSRVVPEEQALNPFNYPDPIMDRNLMNIRQQQAVSGLLSQPVDKNDVVTNAVIPGLIDAGFHPALAAQKDVEYRDMLGKMDEGMGFGTITSTTYEPADNVFGKPNFKHEQTSGLITTEQYQTANLGAYLDSDEVSDKEKIETLNKLQAISNSNLKGTKLSNVKGDDTEQFVIDNLDASFNNIKNQTKYSKYTSQIDEDARTFAKQIDDDGIVKTFFKSGGVLGTMFKSATDQYKNNKALEILGYTGKVIRPEGGATDDYLTGRTDADTRGAVNQIISAAPYVVSGTTAPSTSMVNEYFANLGTNNLGISNDFMTKYNTAKTNMASILDMTPNTQQYGYGNTFASTYPRAMNSGNIFYQYLNEQGLI